MFRATFPEAAPVPPQDLTAPRPGNLSRARVVSVTRLSPSYSRVTVAGPDLARFASGGLHFRLLLGPEGAGWPQVDAGGALHWPGGAKAWHRPVYTCRSLTGTESGAELSFDVFRHDGGRITAWCDRLTPGAEVALTGPGGGGLPPARGWVGLVGDETALPVMARILAALPPATRGHAVLFVPDPADRQDIPHPAGVRLDWVLRGQCGDSPLDRLATLAWPDADRYVVFAGEQAQAVQARAWLPRQGLGKTEFVSAAYWTAA
ncbi:siderophore-interacting protein [Salipiger marinus]|uniref:siderophore-interacting protein n=1 Tax=Salipiger marinus TaxID=555512 RepID=UPI002BFD84C0|nr:siderophore-interacting protein [Salipiger manganoxidans]MEB3419123.1 siderophore-interacting protein [Salipiger manganoxidans]